MIHTPNNSKPQKGFTIVELLIVILVIGILATLVLIAYNNVQGQARDSKRQANAQSVANAAESYRTASKTGTYPDMSSHTSFHNMIDTTANFTNGVSPISVDNSVTQQTVGGTTTNLLTVGTSVTSNANNGMNLVVQYCPTSASPATTYMTATGMKVFYWSESANKGTNYVQTGTGC